MSEEKLNEKMGAAEQQSMDLSGSQFLGGSQSWSAWKSWQPKKPWPENCPWPEPAEWSFDFDEDTLPTARDEETEELLEIKEYFDSLVERGQLNEDYSLNEDYEDPFKAVFSDDEEDEDEEEDDEDEFTPEKGEDYWDDGFDVDSWREDLSYHVNLLRIAPMDPHVDPTVGIRSITQYEFVNENLLRQAFTRRSFSIEYGLDGCSEELEFLGDTILSTVVTKEILRQFSENDSILFTAPFQSKYDEGQMTKLKDQFVSKEALSARARELGLGKYILYGTGEVETDSSLEDMMEALIGAVTLDCGWNMEIIERVVNELLLIQFDCPDSILRQSYYDIMNAWHQKHFGCIPVYEVYKRTPGTGIKRDHGGAYICDIRFEVPENDKGVYTSQRFVDDGSTRSKAREHAAESAYNFLVEKGLWKNLADAKVVPDLENSINQLQELYQKKYVDKAPEYEAENSSGKWKVDCRADSFHGFGYGKTKIIAKKKAAYMVIVEMLMSAGICEKEWKDRMYQNLTD